MGKTQVKKITALILAFIMLLGTIQVSAAYAIQHNAQAETLKSLGLFMGTNTGFNLDKVCTRAEGAVMLVRLLGKEQEATTNADNAHPFTDVPAWADRYVAYLFAKNLTKGMNDTTFGSTGNMTYKQYITFILRSLGYNDTAGDFDYNTCDTKAVGIQLLTAQELTEISKSQPIYRDNVVFISYKALFTKLKDSNNTLLDKLFKTDNAISKEKIEAAAAKDTLMKDYYTKVTTPLTAMEIYNKVSPAVVYIEVQNEAGKSTASGSGFIVSADGIVVTNYHVIKRSYSAFVKTLSDGKYHEVIKVLGFNIERDIAILKIEGENFPFVTLGDSDKIQNAEKIYTIGSPLGLENTISEGLISSKSRIMSDNQSYIQISAPISPGSSGGVLINEFAEIIGITSSGIPGAGNLNFAIPINDYKKIPHDRDTTLAALMEAIPKFDNVEDYEKYLQNNFGTFNSGSYTINFDVMVSESTEDPNQIFIWFAPKNETDINNLLEYAEYGNRADMSNLNKQVTTEANLVFDKNIQFCVAIIKYCNYKEVWPENNITDDIWIADNGGYILVYPITFTYCEDGDVSPVYWFDA